MEEVINEIEEKQAAHEQMEDERGLYFFHGIFWASVMSIPLWYVIITTIRTIANLGN